MTGNTLIEHRWVRVMCDFTASGVWAKGGGACSPDELPISWRLRERIMEWQHQFERLYGIKDFPATSDDREIEQLFVAEGLSIAIEIKWHLPDWTVIYFDETTNLDRGPWPKALYEYEIFPSAHETEAHRRAEAVAELGLVPGVTRVRHGDLTSTFVSALAVRRARLLIEIRTDTPTGSRRDIIDSWEEISDTA